MRTWIAVVLAILGIGIAMHPVINDNPLPLPPGVTTGWPIDPNDPEDTTCGIGIRYEDTFALTDAQLATARKYVAQTCWGAPDNWPTDTEHHYYYHHDQEAPQRIAEIFNMGIDPPPTNEECDAISGNADVRAACARLQNPAVWYSGPFPPVPNPDD